MSRGEELNVQLRLGSAIDPDYRGCWVLTASRLSRNENIEMRIWLQCGEEETKFFSLNRNERNDKQLLSEEQIEGLITLQKEYHETANEFFSEESFRSGFIQLDDRTKDAIERREIVEELKFRWEMLKRIVRPHMT